MINKHLLRAYRLTNFIVTAPGENIVLRHGELNADVDRILEAHGVQECAFITAWNPGSRMLDLSENQIRQEMLRREIETRGYTFFPGYGAGQDSLWPPEDSFLILGMNREDAKAIATQFGQNAILFKSLAFRAELLLCSVQSRAARTRS
jgi:Protein of unknown function (DUF3293)